VAGECNTVDHDWCRAVRKSCSVAGDCGAGGVCSEWPTWPGFTPTRANRAIIYVSQAQFTNVGSFLNGTGFRAAFIDCPGGVCPSPAEATIVGDPLDLTNGILEAEQPWFQNTTAQSFVDFYGPNASGPNLNMLTNSSWTEAIKVLNYSDYVHLFSVGTNGWVSIGNQKAITRSRCSRTRAGHTMGSASAAGPCKCSCQPPGTASK
jgi:hypothetical protein